MNSAVWELFCSLRGPVLTLPQGRQPELKEISSLQRKIIVWWIRLNVYYLVPFENKCWFWQFQVRAHKIPKIHAQITERTEAK